MQTDHCEKNGHKIVTVLTTFGMEAIFEGEDLECLEFTDKLIVLWYKCINLFQSITYILGYKVQVQSKAHNYKAFNNLIRDNFVRLVFI